MRDTMAARGPDGAGLFERANVALAHRRLSIRDLAGGAQPCVSDDGQTVLIYNGEIYNDAVLRRDLERLGHRFRSRCDTEVVLAACRQWGARAVERMRGMFAFGAYDFRDETLLLVRDRFGIKPLYFAEVDNTLVFASTVAAIVAHPHFSRRPNFAVLSHYLTTFRITLGRDTVFEGIQQLLPGEMLRWERGTWHIERYWDYPTRVEDSIDFDEAASLLARGLRESVSLRLASDVPVGMFLSGGVDSNVIAGLVREEARGSIVGQCGVGTGDASEDALHARLCAEHAGFDFGEVLVGPDEYRDCWQWMLDQYQTPVSTPSDVILFRLAQEMKKSAGVVLGGEGADELLCGYAVSHWAGEDYDRLLRLDRGETLVGPAECRLFRQSLLDQYGRDRFASPTDHYFALNSLIPSSAKQALLLPHIWRQAGEDRPMFDRYQALFEHDRNRLGERSTAEMQTALLHRVNLEGLLARLDSATMLAGLEARVPYTDHLLVETMFSIPRPHKIRLAETEQAPYLASGALEQRGSLQSKRVLRRVAEQMLPADLARRKKASFPTPVARWLSGKWARQARRTLLESPFGRDVFQRQALCELAENVSAAGMWLWPILNVLEWGDRQCKAA